MLPIETFYEPTSNLLGFEVAKTSGFSPIIHDLSSDQEPHCCGCDLRKKDKAHRQVWHESVGLRRVLLRFAVCKFHCRTCGRYFRQRFDGILPYHRSTEALKRQVYRHHTDGISRRSLARHCGRSDTTIARYYDHMYDLENRKLRTLRVPRVLGIDEHFFSRRNRFATTFCDLTKRRIFDVAPGRSNADLEPYLHGLQWKNSVRVVCMDLSQTCRSIAQTYFPRALVVADRFHVVRLALHDLMATCRQIDPGLVARRGPLRLLQKHAANLTDVQARRLEAYLSERPALEAIYGFKEDLMAVLIAKHQTKDQCRILVHRLLDAIRQLAASPFEDCRKLARTLESWQVAIGRMWRFSRDRTASPRASIAR